MQARIELLVQQHLLATDIGTLINRVHQEEVEGRPWHRLQSTLVINTVAPKGTDGSTISVTQGSQSVLGVGTSFDQTDVGKFIRIATDDAIYPVQSVQSDVQLTIAGPYANPTVAAGGYNLFVLLYTLSNVGAQRILSVKAVQDLDETTRDEINRRDPARRSSSSLSQAWAPWGRDSSDNILFELWPHASSSRAYIVDYLKGHVDMVNPTDRPFLPSALIENKAMADVCLAIFSRTGDPRWFQQASSFADRYNAEFEKAVAEDDKQYGMPEQVRDAGAYGPGMDLFVTTAMPIPR